MARQQHSTTSFTFLPATREQVPADFDYPNLIGEVYVVQQAGVTIGMVWTTNGIAWCNSQVRSLFCGGYRVYVGKNGRARAAMALVAAQQEGQVAA